MATPTLAQPAPFFVDVEEGNTYTWCACGRSANQPYCDGSHSGTGIAPVTYTAPQSRRVLFCGCKATKKAPMCDGAHDRL